MGSESDSGECPECMRDPRCSSRAIECRGNDRGTSVARSAMRVRKGSMIGYAMPACSSSSTLDQHGASVLAEATCTSRSMLKRETDDVPAANVK